ncbi:MAG: hypothetical protein OEQ81_11795 [Flavobacteriaceae bacterium]|nr:hypothetical protein [Flavobacteriaceae bacterium]
MKTESHNKLSTIFKLCMFSMLMFTFSCTQDSVLHGENLEVANAKSNNSILKTFIQGAALNGANGIDIGADGNLYIASINGQEIVVMNKNNGKIINRFGPESGVLGPDDLVFGPDGTLYWTDLLTGFVGRMTPDGVQLGYQFVGQGVNPITFSEDGRLFVALDFLGDGLYELDPELIDPPRPIVVCSDPDNPFCLGFFNSFNVGPDGRLYGPLFALNLVISVNVDPGNPVTSDPFNDPNLDLQIVAGLGGEFSNPAAAKFGPDGLLTVSDQSSKVFKIDIQNNNELTLFTTLPPALDNMTFDSDGTLYMTNADEGWVAEILPSGQPRYISPGGMILPQGLAVIEGSDGKDKLYEADLFRLRQFNASSGRQENIYKGILVPEGPESLILPMNISADGDNLIISSWFSSGVQVWNPDLGVIDSYPDVEVPIDAVRVNGDIVVSDVVLGGVVYASDNSLIAPLFVASGLATDGETLWAADWATGDIWQIEFDGTPATIVASGLAKPEGLALDLEGRLLVVETGTSQLSRVDLATGEVTVLAQGLELFGEGLGSPPTWGFDGVAVGSNGDIYISGAGATVVYRIRANKVR